MRSSGGVDGDVRFWFVGGGGFSGGIARRGGHCGGATGGGCGIYRRRRGNVPCIIALILVHVQIFDILSSK